MSFPNEDGSFEKQNLDRWRRPLFKSIDKLPYLQAIFVVPGSAPFRKSCLHKGMPWGAVIKRGPVTTETRKKSRLAGMETGDARCGAKGSGGCCLRTAAASCSSLLRAAPGRAAGLNFRSRKPVFLATRQITNRKMRSPASRRKRFKGHCIDPLRHCREKQKRIDDSGLRSELAVLSQTLAWIRSFQFLPRKKMVQLKSSINRCLQPGTREACCCDCNYMHVQLTCL